MSIITISLKVRPRQESNLRPRLRRAVLYPLSYGGSWGSSDEKVISVLAIEKPERINK
jgi:hypothetical protein